MTYTLDANGILRKLRTGLLFDGVNTYTYDYTNRLTSVNGPSANLTYTYNGLGDRLETVTNAITTTRYTLDTSTSLSAGLAAGLTQVLVDGDFTYLYGNGRVAQSGANGMEYFIGDALGSVRQLVDAGGEVTLAQSYTPYGEVLATEGEATTSYAFTGEALDAYTGLVYLRARWYGPAWGRFVSRDVWDGNKLQPSSYNLWLYTGANPINHLDPSGKCTIEEYGDGKCEPPDFGIPGCDRKCVEEATKPLKDWSEIYTFRQPEKAFFTRLLLAEIGWRIISNANWQTEASGILWTVKNRVTWERQRVDYDNQFRKSTFLYCDKGNIPCATRPGQYATTSTTRGRDPLFQDPDQPGKRKSYYHKIEYIPIAIFRANLIAERVLYGKVTDPTNIDGKGGAHFFSHKPPPKTHFSRVVDVFCWNKLIHDYEYKQSNKEQLLALDYIQNIPSP